MYAMFYHLKQKNTTYKKLISGLLIAGVLFAFGTTPRVVGQTADDLQQQKAAKQQQLDAIEKQIADYQTQINQAQGKVNTLQGQINILNLEIAQTQAQIKATENKVDTANLEIADVTNKIVKTQSDIDKEKSILKTLIKDINNLDQESPLEIALENDNFQQFLDQVQYIDSIQQQSQEALTKIKQFEADLQIRQADLKTEKSNLDTLLSQLDSTNSSLAQQQKSKQTLVTQTKGQEKAYQKLLGDSQETEKQLNDEIYNLDSQIAAKLGNNKLAAHHGLLAWPLNGTLSQGYGNTGFTSLGYNFHNGIDIAAPAGTPIHSAGDGTVAATGTGNGAYGNWVAIRHDTGKYAVHPIVTLYGHMSSFIMHTGQVVGEGDVVGFEGNTGNTTRLIYGPLHGFHLHFTVFDAAGFGVADGAYQKTYGAYTVPYGATYNPLDFL